jgi:hypothetical protein
MLKSCTKASAREYQTSISSCRLSASLLTTTKAFVVVRARVSNLHFVSLAVGLASHNNKRFSCRPREKQKARTTTKAKKKNYLFIFYILKNSKKNSLNLV